MCRGGDRLTAHWAARVNDTVMVSAKKHVWGTRNRTARSCSSGLHSVQSSHAGGSGRAAVCWMRASSTACAQRSPEASQRELKVDAPIPGCPQASRVQPIVWYARWFLSALVRSQLVQHEPRESSSLRLRHGARCCQNHRRSAKAAQPTAIMSRGTLLERGLHGRARRSLF